jgi:hypothetical protein
MGAFSYWLVCGQRPNQAAASEPRRFGTCLAHGPSNVELRMASLL